MKRGDLDDLAAFAVVARTRSFTRAAAEIGLSPSALSHAMRGLEQRLGVTLLARTTRSVAPTAAGKQLLHALEPALAGLAQGLASLENWRDTPAGNIRLTTLHYASRTILADKLPAFLRDHPDITIEVTIDDRLTDIVAGGFDAGIRPGGAVDNDMIAIRLEPDSRARVVGTPDYFARYPRPQTLQDLQDHRCINYRRVTTGDVVPWRFERDGETINIKTGGQLIVNDGVLAGATIRAGAGLGILLEHEAAAELADGRLIAVLDGWSPTFHGCHLYYPNRQITPALRALVAALRWRGD
ncbi:LysR family transcriptional regulator [Shimwellia pseudoproteus]|uniref:LysR family transcriptional regulator n=1 Tax=Shimwellia pseudoproteus TaxID=570012 RepID=UPI0018EBCFA5|nr:LysR family transcriptional regulator [Shimwellia pseudoproteus]MBJ3816508.1 LysR family transcriptional regulator [Shimwellia pseudoproteus]